MGSELVMTEHLSRKAVVYVRQSTPHQVLNNQESLRLQYALCEQAREFGWHEADIEVIDCDLGQSGATAIHRLGFKDLVARVTLNEVGIIFSREVTRLARNCTDWYSLLDVCGQRRCLIADRDGVYDPGLPNGRLLLGLKGSISELELHTLQGRLTAGLLAKAQRGDLVMMLPVGLCRDPAGVVTKDPDQEVQLRIAVVFDTFFQVRTAAGVVRAFNSRGLTLPRRDRQGDTRWCPPTLASIIDFLKNPAYAGAFVYGRTRLRPATLPGGSPLKTQRRCEEWRFVVKDKYPAYIDWDSFERIQAILRDNRAEYARVHSRGIPRDGAALLHGITWCGKCGHKMVVRYKGGSQYVCNHLHQQYGAEECQHLRATPVDAAVATAFLQAIAPAEIEVWVRARQAHRQAEAAMLKAELQQIERLRYQAALAERQFNHVDPQNRLVAAELEHRWETALVEVRQAEESLARRKARQAAPDPFDNTVHEKVIQLGRTMPDLWANPSVSREHRKALLRCLIEKVVLTRVVADRIAIRIVWRGGETTELDVAHPVNDSMSLSCYQDMERRIRVLVVAGESDADIARTLSAEGYRSPTCTTGVLPNTVSRIRRYRLQLPSQVRPTRWVTPAGWLSITAVARRLQIPAKWFYSGIRHGKIRIDRDPATGRHLFPDTEQVLEMLSQLWVEKISSVDFRRHQSYEEGHHYG
jgi:DNA invertase Pin-like site-specific DNA recombinase